MTQLTTYPDFLKRVDELGFMSLSTLLPGLPSLSDETPGSLWHTGDHDTDPWRWKDRAAEEKRAAYGCILNGHKGFVSARLYPIFFSAYRPVEAMSDRWANGHVKQTTWELYQLFEKKALLDTSDVRREMRVSAKSGASRVDAALKELQSQFYLAISGSRRKTARDGQQYGWAASIYQRVDNWAPASWLEGVRALDSIAACETLLDIGVNIGQNLERDALAKVLGFLPG
jgi:hypothetical protein